MNETFQVLSEQFNLVIVLEDVCKEIAEEELIHILENFCQQQQGLVVI